MEKNNFKKLAVLGIASCALMALQSGYAVEDAEASLKALMPDSAAFVSSPLEETASNQEAASSVAYAPSEEQAAAAAAAGNVGKSVMGKEVKPAVEKERGDAAALKSTKAETSKKEPAASEYPADNLTDPDPADDY